jgi:hypothetical protein
MVGMDIDVMPTLIDQYRETFEGDVGPNWITDGKRETAVLGLLDALTPEQAFATPPGRKPGARSIAAHVEHLRFSLDLLLERMHGKNPAADWARSFDLAAPSPAAWETLKRELRRAYDGVLALLQESRGKAVGDMPPIHVVGLAATIAHNAYHLGAIQQMALAVRGR